MFNKKKWMTVILVSIVIVLFSVVGIQYNLFADKADSSANISINTTEMMNNLQSEKIKIQVEKHNLLRLESEKKKAQEALIKTNTWISGKNGAIVYSDRSDQRTEITKLNPRTEVYIERYYLSKQSDVTDQSTGYLETYESVLEADATIEWVEIKSGYDANASLGFVKYNELEKNKMAFIQSVYDDVDYSAFSKTESYKNNPAINVKGVYMTGNSATSSKKTELLKLVDETEINALVIDVKDDNGYLLFHSKTAEELNPLANEKVYIDDIASFMAEMKAHDVYLIARIVTFKSPIYAKENPDKAIVYKNSGKLYSDRDNLIWASAHNRDLWAYNVGIAKEAAELGFNEIQFDYVRFPAIYNTEAIDYRNPLNESQTATIQGFLKYAYGILSKEEVYIAADVFGWTATAINDVGIGQHWEAITNVVDYICPMMYPSHYGANIFGLSVPDAYPYETVDYSIKDAISRNNNVETPAKIRPWIQDFTAGWVEGNISYGDDEVRAQIDALHDNGIEDYILWNSRNYYSENALKGVNYDE